jgi:hypothetical protein
MARSIAIKCPSCGASSFENSNGGDRSCLYCRTTFRVPEDAPPVILKRASYPPPPHPRPLARTGDVGRVVGIVWFVFIALLMIVFLIKFFSAWNSTP